MIYPHPEEFLWAIRYGPDIDLVLHVGGGLDLLNELVVAVAPGYILFSMFNARNKNMIKPED